MNSSPRLLSLLLIDSHHWGENKVKPENSNELDLQRWEVPIFLVKSLTVCRFVCQICQACQIHFQCLDLIFFSYFYFKS